MLLEPFAKASPVALVGMILDFLLTAGTDCVLDRPKQFDRYLRLNASVLVDLLLTDRAEQREALTHLKMHAKGHSHVTSP